MPNCKLRIFEVICNDTLDVIHITLGTAVTNVTNTFLRNFQTPHYYYGKTIDPVSAIIYRYNSRGQLLVDYRVELRDCPLT